MPEERAKRFGSFGEQKSEREEEEGKPGAFHHLSSTEQHDLARSRTTQTLTERQGSRGATTERRTQGGAEKASPIPLGFGSHPEGGSHPRGRRSYQPGPHHLGVLISGRCVDVTKFQ